MQRIVRDNKKMRTNQSLFIRGSIYDGVKLQTILITYVAYLLNLLHFN